MLSGFEGIVVTDAYNGYEKVAGVTRALCFAHVRRYWIDAIPLDSRGKELPGSLGAEGRKWCDNLFKIEREIKDLSTEERLKEGKERSEPLLEAYFAWVEELSCKVTVNEKLKTFLSDGRIPISNNWNESKLRNYAVVYNGSKEQYKPREYEYDLEHDRYICPKGGILRHTTTSKDGKRTYRTDPMPRRSTPCVIPITEVSTG